MTFFLPRVVVRACTNALQKENKNKNNNNSDDRWFFCVRLKSHAYVRDVSRSSNLSVFFAREGKSGEEEACKKFDVFAI